MAALSFLLLKKPPCRRQGCLLTVKRICPIHAELVQNCNNIVKGMSSGSNSKTTNCKKDCKINPCDCSKSKLRKIKRIYSIRLPTEKIYMVVRAKQRCRNENRKYNRITMVQSKNILKKQHQNTYQNQAKNKLFVYPCTYSGNNIC